MNSIGKARNLVALPFVLACFCGNANAADLATRKAPAPVPPPPAFTWQGLYIGFNYGYTWKGSSGISTAGAPLYDSTLVNLWPVAAATGASGIVNGRLNGFFGGGQLGYNWQFGGVVLGLEADLQGGGIRGGGGYGSITPADLIGSVAATSANIHRNLEHFGTVRGRIGYTITPTIMGYVTGGLAYGGASMNATVNQALSPSAFRTGNAHAEKFQELTGWTLGAGAEMAIAPNLSAKLEYLYYDLGSMRMLAPNFGPLMQTHPVTGLGIGTGLASSTRFNGQILRAGLNYKFGGQSAEGAPLPAFALVGAERAKFGDWSVTFLPYVWGIGLNGTSTALGQTSDVNASFVDMLTKTSSFPLEFSANAEVRNGPLSFYGDFVWTQIRLAGSTMALRSPIAGAALTLEGGARMKMTLAILEGGGTFEMARWGYAGAPAAFTAIDAVAGLRYWNNSASLSLNIAGAVNVAELGFSQVGAKAIARSGTMSWVDPFVGLRLRQQIDAANSFYIKGDVGGFGVGSSFSWQAAGGYTHDFQFAGFNWTGMVGYRALYVDYSRGSGLQRVGMNAVVHGPVTGIGFKF